MRTVAKIICVALLLLAPSARAQVHTTISDTVYSPTGGLANGSVTITNPLAFTAADGTVVAANGVVTVVVTNGVLSVALIPNQGSNPLGSYYLANYNVSGATYQETWIVPQSLASVKLIAVRAQVLPYLGLTAAFDQLNPPVGCLPNQFPQWLAPGWGCGSSTGSGTVTSVGLTTPSWLVPGGPVTTSGNLSFAPATGQTSHQVIGTCGSATSFAPCALVAADIPQIAYSSLSGLPTLNLFSALTAGTNSTAGTFAFSGNTFDLSAVAGFKVPTAANCAATASLMECYDSTNKNMHLWTNGADAINGAFASAPTTGDVVTATVVAGGVTLSDSGLLGTNLVTQASNAAANQICAYTGINKICVPTTTLPTAAFPALTGDVTNSAGSLATTVVQVQGAVVPLSALAVGTNASRQLIAAALQGTDTKLLTAGTVAGTGATLCTDANGGATTTGCSSGGGATFQANGTNLANQTTINFVNSAAVTGITLNASNPSVGQVTFTFSGTLNPTGGGTGLSNPTAHSLFVAEGSSNFNLVTSPSTNGVYVCAFNVVGSAAVDPTCSQQGVPVNAQSASYTLLYSDRATYIKESGGTTATLTLPQVTGNTASNFPFVTQNLNSGSETITANAADKIDNGATGGSQTVFPNWAAWVYQDQSSAPGNWWTIRVPTFAAFPNCNSATNALTFNTATGVFGCNSIAGGGGLPSIVGTASNVTAQSTSQSAVTIATAPTAGQYEVQYYADLNTACTTGANSVSFTFNWTDASGTARSLQTGNLTMGTSQAGSSYVSGAFPLWVGSGNVTYTSTVSGACGSGTSSYDVHIPGLMRVQ